MDDPCKVEEWGKLTRFSLFESILLTTISCVRKTSLWKQCVTYATWILRFSIRIHQFHMRINGCLTGKDAGRRRKLPLSTLSRLYYQILPPSRRRLSLRRIDLPGKRTRCRVYSILRLNFGFDGSFLSHTWLHTVTRKQRSG